MLDGTSIRRYTGGFTCRKVAFSLCTVFAWVIIVSSDPNETKCQKPRVTFHGPQVARPLTREFAAQSRK